MPLRLISRQAQMIKSYYSGIGKTAVTCVAAFVMAVALGTIMLGMVFYLGDVFNATGGQVGMFFGVWSLCYILGCLFFRPISDSIKPRYLLVLSAFSMFLWITAVLSCASFSLACVFYGLAAASCSLFWPPMMGWLSVRLQGAELSRVMSRFNMSWSTGAIVSPFMAGWLSEKQAVLPIQVGAGLMLLTSVLLLGAALTLPKVRDEQEASPPDPQDTAETGKPTRLRYAAWVGAFTTFTVMGVIMNIFPLAAQNELGLSKRMIGALLLGRTLFTTAGFAVMGRTVFWHYRGSQMLLGQLCLIGTLLAMLFMSHPVTIGLVLAVFGLMIALSYFNSLFHGMVGSTNRVGRGALHEVLLSAGMITGSVAGGHLYEHFSIQKAYMFCMATALVGAIIQIFIVLWAKKHETHEHIDLKEGTAHDEG